VGEELQRPYPEEPYPFPACGIERRKDERGFNYVIRWPRKLKFEGDSKEKETVWFNANKETYEGEAEEACWEYFQEVQRCYARQGSRGELAGHPDGFGPFEGKYGEHKWLHGTPNDHIFRVVRRPFGDGTNPGNKMVIRNWNPVEDTAIPAEQVCGNCRHRKYVDGSDHYECLGHELVSSREAVDADDQMVVRNRTDDRIVPSFLGQNGDAEVQAEEIESGMRRVPGPEHGVAAGDPAGEVPVSRNLDGFDYWEVHPARGAISRVHVEWRRSLYNPANLPAGVEMGDLQKVRVTQKEFADGTADVEQDEWGETPRVSSAGVTRMSRGAWRGTTWFFLENANPVPGPARRRIVGKKPRLCHRGVGAAEEVEDGS